MTRKEQNKITRETHERVEIYDWALDLDINEDFGQWLEELSEDIVFSLANRPIETHRSATDVHDPLHIFNLNA